uniref:Uncharacterized protein n=1 Tax=Aplanochytrium stocchinoi TaxID=215587 RepID=A0A7S3V1R0_9STRA|mmetsp:Transcript_12340/g.16037  ORF Transcript_12340/g.16037 Transcript_12340/m.16037 type:complete len:453 (+) Transcript_12340:128-1486(+)|eukprot:CAMPEP_0204868122 /NCGR_PEP_ID=MMETSP1348-20121228/25526_1 /ASSEMBLY_ACC=CAM_ASM_000700 /TAXON_ID=215587 /ORGANISM="Aplanochytrium stocchinoi, Strain GSBS06" /LENGTH=452 /DNA_ID=CAMNT_0052020919 /DNA_START=121 /DNA_END=1479 /DNA_ORIENTATION=+
MGNSSSNSPPQFNTDNRRLTTTRQGRSRKSSFEFVRGFKPFQRKRARPGRKLRRKAETRRPHYALQALSSKPPTFAPSNYENSITPTDCYEPLNPTGSRTDFEKTPQGNGYSWNAWKKRPKSKKARSSTYSLPESLLEETSFAPYLENSLEKLEDTYKDLVEMYNDPQTPHKWAVEKELYNVNRAIESSPEYKIREREKMVKWEKEQRSKNLECLGQMRALVPEDIQKLCIKDLVNRSINEKLARRFVRIKALHLYHMPHDEIQKLYRGDLVDQNGRYSYVDLDIIEMRALFALVSEEVPSNRNMKKWKEALARSLYELTEKENRKSLPQRLARHPDYSGKKNNERRGSTRRSFNRASDDSSALEGKKSNLVSDMKKRLSAIHVPNVTEESSVPANRSGSVEACDDEDADDDDIAEIMKYVKSISIHYSDPEELERALSSIKFDDDDENELI